MTDEEVICTWMEPQPKYGTDHGHLSDGLWWWMGRSAWEPTDLTLDALWEVEERLTYDQRERVIRSISGSDSPHEWRYLHVTPAQKIKALAAVLRPLVEETK